MEKNQGVKIKRKRLEGESLKHMGSETKFFCCKKAQNMR